MKFEPTEKSEQKDTSTQFCLRASVVPVITDFFLCIACIFAMLFFNVHSNVQHFIRLTAIGLSPIAMIGLILALIDWRCTLVFVSKFRLKGQKPAFRPSSRRVELSLEEIKDIEVRATMGTRFFKYAHLIIYPEYGKKIALRHIYYAEERAIRMLDLQSQIQKTHL